jgi:hypothetical protein
MTEAREALYQIQTSFRVESAHVNWPLYGFSEVALLNVFPSNTHPCVQTLVRDFFHLQLITASNIEIYL